MHVKLLVSNWLHFHAAIGARVFLFPSRMGCLLKNGEQLLAALNFFVSSVNTLANKTMEDSIATVKNYETARRVDKDIHLLRNITSWAQLFLMFDKYLFH